MFNTMRFQSWALIFGKKSLFGLKVHARKFLKLF